MSYLRIIAVGGAVFLFNAGLSCAGWQEKASDRYFSGKTESALNLCLDHAKDDPAAALEASFLLFDLGDSKRAQVVLSSASALFPTYPGLRAALALAELDCGNCARAAELYEERVSYAPQDRQALLGLGRAKLCSGDTDAAQAALLKFLALRPGTLGWYFLGRTYEVRRDTEAAVDAYRHVLEMDSQFIEVRASLAELFHARQDHNEAWRQYRKLSYADPQNEELKKKTGQLAELITKKPEEILPPKSLFSFTQLASSPSAALPVLRVGIGTGAGGSTGKRNKISFSVSASFSLRNKGAVLAAGGPQETWTVRLSTAGRAELLSPGGKTIQFSGVLLVEPESPESTIILRRLTVDEGTSWGGVADRELRGRLELRPDAERGAIVAVNLVPLEQYLYGVLPAEMPWYYPLEALKAQAVLARTYSYRNRGKHSKQGYDLCDSQHCQVYGGVASERKNTSLAVDATRGELLLYKGRAIEAVFSSNSGGVTATGSDAGWDDKPYWTSVSDINEDTHQAPASAAELAAFLRNEPKAFSSPSVYVHSPSYRWQRAVLPAVISKRVARKKHIGELQSVAVLERRLSGRVARVRLKGSAGSVVLEKENEIRKYLSAGLLRSIFFWVENVYGPDGKLQLLLFNGAGWGHGVGFCQAGSSGMAEEGHDYRLILRHYYPGTELKQLESADKR